MKSHFEAIAEKVKVLGEPFNRDELQELASKMIEVIRSPYPYSQTYKLEDCIKKVEEWMVDHIYKDNYPDNVYIKFNYDLFCHFIMRFENTTSKEALSNPKSDDGFDQIICMMDFMVDLSNTYSFEGYMSTFSMLAIAANRVSKYKDFWKEFFEVSKRYFMDGVDSCTIGKLIV